VSPSSCVTMRANFPTTQGPRTTADCFASLPATPSRPEKQQVRRLYHPDQPKTSETPASPG
jgi:hypothetical protein